MLRLQITESDSDAEAGRVPANLIMEDEDDEEEDYYLPTVRERLLA